MTEKPTTPYDDAVPDPKELARYIDQCTKKIERVLYEKGNLKEQVNNTLRKMKPDILVKATEMAKARAYGRGLPERNFRITIKLSELKTKAGAQIHDLDLHRTNLVEVVHELDKEDKAIETLKRICATKIKWTVAYEIKGFPDCECFMKGDSDCQLEECKQHRIWIDNVFEEKPINVEVVSYRGFEVFML